MTDPIRTWAERYVGELNEAREERSLAAQRARLLMAHRARRRVRRPWTTPAALLGAALVVVALGATWALRLGGEEREWPELAGQAVSSGASIDARAASQELTFSGGTRATWKKQAQGRLVKFSDSEVELGLETGRLEMDVVHQAGKTWTIRAGEFRVFVIGTAFTVDYDQKTGAVDVQVERGRVRVEGPHVRGGGLLLAPGEKFAWSPSSKHEPSRADELSPPAQKVSPRDEEGEQSTAENPPIELQKDVSEARREATTWIEEARRGEYESAMQKVERLGVDRALRSAGPDELVLLGNAARYSGRGELGVRAYRAARKTPGSAATLAAYYLAKAALDGGGKSTEAIRWLRVYLREAKQGELAASARARLMALLEASGDRAGAVAIAREYLELHPSGPHLQAAQRLLASP